MRELILFGDLWCLLILLTATCRLCNKLIASSFWPNDKLHQSNP